jgi:MFS family permease
MLAMIIITIGEMIVAPVAQALVASFAPEDMRGRYMAVSGFSWGIPFAVGPYLAGLILDGPRPDLLWYVAGLIGILSTLGFLALHRARGEQPEGKTVPEVI